MSKTVQILVSGNVQGVGFRNFVATHAEALGLSGWVRNLRDGRVEILVWAEAGPLESFCSQVEQGPSHSSVDDMKIIEVSAAERNGDDFEVKPDGGEAWSQN